MARETIPHCTFVSLTKEDCKHVPVDWLQHFCLSSCNKSNTFEPISMKFGTGSFATVGRLHNFMERSSR